MKIFLSLILLSVSGLSFGQSAEEKKFAVKANPLPFLVDNNTNESYFLVSTALRVGLEKPVSERRSLVLELGFAGPVTFDVENGEAGESIATTGFLAAFGNKFYMKNSSVQNGAYLLPTLNYSNIRLLEHPEGLPRSGYVGFTDYGVSGVIGYQSTWGKSWVLDVHAGMRVFQRNYYDNTYMESTNVINHNEIGIKPALGLSVGKWF